MNVSDIHARSPRRPTRRQLLSLAAAGAAAVTAAGSHAEPAAAQANDPLVGSWVSVFKRSDGEIIGAPLTFHANGTLLNQGSDELTGTTAHGHWSSLGNGQYAYSVLRLNIDAGGNFSGFRAIDADVTLDQPHPARA